MQCHEVAQKYEEYLLGHFSPQECESLSAHIQDCADCFLLDESNLEFLPEGKFKRFIRTNWEVRNEFLLFVLPIDVNRREVGGGSPVSGRPFAQTESERQPG